METQLFTKKQGINFFHKENPKNVDSIEIQVVKKNNMSYNSMSCFKTMSGETQNSNKSEKQHQKKYEKPEMFLDTNSTRNNNICLRTNDSIFADSNTKAKLLEKEIEEFKTELMQKIKSIKNESKNGDEIENQRVKTNKTKNVKQNDFDSRVVSLFDDEKTENLFSCEFAQTSIIQRRDADVLIPPKTLPTKNSKLVRFNNFETSFSDRKLIPIIQSNEETIINDKKTLSNELLKTKRTFHINLIHNANQMGPSLTRNNNELTNALDQQTKQNKTQNSMDEKSDKNYSTNDTKKNRNKSIKNDACFVIKKS